MFKLFARIILKLSRLFIIKLSDEKYIKIKYKMAMNKELDLKNPKTYNEKLQWLKLYNKNPEYTNMVDKYEAKKIASKIIGDEYIIPTIAVYNKFKDINFDNLPSQFVMKCTHDSGGIVIIKDKNELNKKKAKKIINKSLKRNYFYYGREWPYKNVKPRIIIEKYMEDNKTQELRDYKFLCFNGKPEIMFVATDRSKHETKFNYYDMNYKLLDIRQSYPNDERKIEKPKNFEKMIELATKMSKGYPHIRIDFYEINGKIFFGEFTFYHYSGFTPFYPEKWDIELGKKIDLSLVKNNEK